MRAMAKPIINHRGPEFRELYRRMLDNLKFAFETKGDVFVVSASERGESNAQSGTYSPAATRLLFL